VNGQPGSLLSRQRGECCAWCGQYACNICLFWPSGVVSRHRATASTAWCDAGSPVRSRPISWLTGASRSCPSCICRTEAHTNTELSCRALTYMVPMGCVMLQGGCLAAAAASPVPTAGAAALVARGHVDLPVLLPAAVQGSRRPGHGSSRWVGGWVRLSGFCVPICLCWCCFGGGMLARLIAIATRCTVT
jgi:hypothetical protein